MLTKTNKAKIDKELARKLRQVSCGYWLVSEKIKLTGGDFTLTGHEYQLDWLECKHPNQVFKK